MVRIPDGLGVDPSIRFHGPAGGVPRDCRAMIICTTVTSHAERCILIEGPGPRVASAFSSFCQWPLDIPTFLAPRTELAEFGQPRGPDQLEAQAGFKLHLES